MRVTRADHSSSSILPQVIEVEFPEEKYQQLLKFLGFAELESLSAAQFRKVFVNAVHRFLTGQWSQDELSVLANELWSTKGEKWDEFGSALYDCSELIFYVRSVYDPAAPEHTGNFEAFMTTTIQFYEHYIAEVVK